MWVLIVIMLSGGASSSNINSIEFGNETACRKASAVLKTNDEVKQTYCLQKR